MPPERNGMVHSMGVRLLRMAALAGAVWLPLAGCRSCGPVPRELAVIRIGMESEPLSLDPAAQQEAATHSILSNMYEPLVAFDKDERLVAALAASWDSIGDRTWLVHLRKDVLFHNGAPFTAADVKYTIERYRDDPISVLRGHLSNIERVDVVDRMTVALTTREPEPLLMNRLTYILILPDSGLPAVLTHPVGTGPYRFVSWRRGGSFETEAYAAYWGGRPAFGRAVFVTVKEGPDSLSALQRGEVDVLRFVPETMIGAVETTPGLRLLSRPGLLSYYLWFNPAQQPGAPRNPFADRRVRRAISMAVDRTEIVEALGGRALPANQLAQKGVFGYVAGLPDLTFDPDEARRLLREAGYEGGFETRLTHRSQAIIDLVARLLRDMLGKVGIRAAIETPDWPTALTRWRSGDIPFFLAGWRFEDGEVENFLRDCLFTREPSRNLGSFNPGYSNPELDRLIAQSAHMLGENERLAHYETLTRLALDDMPLVPLFHRFNFYAAAADIQWEPRLDGKLLAAEMTRKRP
ncbi:MAG: ABC transporter substrate-binding protein [Acidobacteriota bacterium]